jgi:hypothetical protein
MIKDLYFIFGKYSHIWLNLSKDDCDLQFSYKQKLLKKKHYIPDICISYFILFGKISQSGHRKNPLVQRLILERNWPTLMRKKLLKSPYLDKRL